MLIDWASVAKGPGAFDLADILFGMTPAGNIEGTVGIYMRALAKHGVTNTDRGRVRHQLGGALLRKMISATCGVARWQPGSEREERMIGVGLDRISEAIEYWKRLDPKLINFDQLAAARPTAPTRSISGNVDPTAHLARRLIYSR